MEESQSTVQINGEEENGDEFYERIEAPKFVDLNAPDHYHPGDDRYWFCSRVGCDQKHEEEMDSEAIYKNFVLRVMAARSPNLRLRKALYKRDSSVRCPQSVPAKPSKPKLSRLALISSISKKLVDPKLKVEPLPKPVATPNVKEKQSSAAARALTTPGKKKQLSNPDAFRSVRNPKATALVVPKNRIVAKALVFHSPKKKVRVKTSLELKTPMKTLCEAMKKLEITGGKMTVQGNNRAVALDASRKQTRGREVKSRVYDGLLPRKNKAPEAKSPKVLKKKNTEKSLHAEEGIQNHFSEPKMEEKSRACVEVCSTSNSEENEVTQLPNSEEGNFVDGNLCKSQAPSGENIATDGMSQEEGIKPCLETGKNKSEQSCNKEHAVAAEIDAKELHSGENGNEETIKLNLESNKTKECDNDKENGGKAMDSDDKENTSASDENRDLDTGPTQRKVLGKHEIPTQKISKAISKISKVSSTTAATGAQGVKQIKPRPTNPKPFRLRTDERRILKEANLEKKPHAPLREIMADPKLPCGKKQKNAVQVSMRNENCVEQGENGNTQKVLHKNGTSSLKISKERSRRKISTTPQRHTVSSQQKLVTPMQAHGLDKAPKKVGNNLKKTKSPLVRQNTRPREASSRTEEMVSIMTPGQLDVINETSPTNSRHKDAAKPSESGPSTVSASRPPLQGKRLTTIPKEPNFHTVHLPKSCTRRVA